MDQSVTRGVLPTQSKQRPYCALEKHSCARVISLHSPPNHLYRYTAAELNIYGTYEYIQITLAQELRVPKLKDPHESVDRAKGVDRAREE